MLSSAPWRSCRRRQGGCPPELKDRHFEIDWIAVAAAGNIFRHEYEGVDEKLIWHTVRHDLAALRSVAVTELERIRCTQ